MFGDHRIENRLELVLTTLTKQMDSSVAQASLEWKKIKGTYRLWDNDRVNPDKLIRFHWDNHVGPLLGRGTSSQRVLQLSDTVELDYTGSRSSPFLGPLSYKHQRGVRLHNSLLISHIGTPLGLLKQSYHVRQAEEWGKSRERTKRPFEDKESYRWYQHFQAGQALCQQDANLEVVYIADREADIMELFVQRTQPNMHFVIRSRFNRKQADGRGNLIEQINNWATKGTYTTRVYQEKTRKFRQAQLRVRFGQTQVALHKALPHKRGLPAVQLYVVDVEEITPGIEQKERIHWRLLSTLAVESMADARMVIQYYLLRWLIERFHFLLKTGGAHVENLQLKTPQRLLNAITTYSIVAMEAFKLRYLAEKSPDESIRDVGIAEIEYKVLYTYAAQGVNLKVKYDPDNPPTVKQYCIVLGQITGFLPSKRQPIPGLKIITRSLEKLQILVDAYAINWN